MICAKVGREFCMDPPHCPLPTHPSLLIFNLVGGVPCIDSSLLMSVKDLKFWKFDLSYIPVISRVTIPLCPD
jgi:hypothetical protein